MDKDSIIISLGIHQFTGQTNVDKVELITTRLSVFGFPNFMLSNSLFLFSVEVVEESRLLVLSLRFNGCLNGP